MAIEEEMEKARKEIEREIKRKLLDKEMSQRDLAELLNISPNAVTEAVRGYTNPRAIKNRKKIYRVLGMDE